MNHIVSLIESICSIKQSKANAVAQALGVGAKGISVSDPLSPLRQLSLAQIEQAGLTHKQAQRLESAIALGKLLFIPKVLRSTIIDGPETAAIALFEDLSFQDVEKVALLALNIKHGIIAKQIIHVGTSIDCDLNPREILRTALKVNAVRLIIAHNHPTGSLNPSSADLGVTKRLINLGHELGIPLIDHLIIGNHDFLSIRQNTTLWLDAEKLHKHPYQAANLSA